MKIKHVYGNVLKLDIPLTIKIRTMESDVPTEREEPFYPDVSKGCTVILGNSYNRKIQYDATVSGNVAHIEDDGVIGIGTYKVTVKCYDEEGNPYRYMVRDIIEICDATIDAGIEAGVEFNVETYTLEGAVFVSYGGEQVQSDWAETDPEEKSFIKNKPDLTQYATKNELREVESEIPTLPDHIVTDEHYVHTDNNYTAEEKQKLAGLHNYDDTQVRALIQQTADNFTNYYTKFETYSQAQVDQLLRTQREGQYVPVNTLPTASADTMFKIYLVPSSDPQTSNIKDEYITIDNGSEATTRYTWEKIGSTAVDLSGYSTTEEMNAAIASALASYYTKTEADALLGGKQDTISDLSTIRSGAQAGATAYQKPAGGIPKTDLAQDVKDSLDKADSALQEDTLYEDANGHDYVEIAGMKWATKNIGAENITDAGLYFQWGDTQGYTAAQVGSGEGQKYFSENDCIYCNDGSYTKYNEGDSKITLEASDDAVTAAWGGGWRMPTVSEFIALGEAVNTAWTTDYQGSGVSGLVCTDNTDNSKVLFFPACGSAYYGSVLFVGSYGYYWSSSLNADYGDSNAYNLNFNNGNVGWQNDDDRCNGFPVRPILDTTQLKQDLDSKANTEDLADVAFSGSYNDLDDKPTIPTVPTNVSAFNNDAGYLTQHQDISGKADKSEMSVVDGTGANADKTTITLKNGTSATVLKSHQDVSGKQDKIDSSHKLSADLVDDTNTTNKFTNATEKQTWNGKQDALVSGTNIKTINNESVLGGGNINIVTELPSNLAYTSNDNGEGIIPSDGIRAVTVTSAATMTISPDVVTIIDGAVGTAAITLQVPQDNLAHVWDILMTTDSSVAITFAMSNSETILTPSGFSVGASKAVEISVIGVGTKYYLRYGEFA